jgi:hypothetical protein
MTPAEVVEAETLTTSGMLLLPPCPPAMTEFRREYVKVIGHGLQQK